MDAAGKGADRAGGFRCARGLITFAGPGRFSGREAKASDGGGGGGGWARRVKPEPEPERKSRRTHVRAGWGAKNPSYR